MERVSFALFQLLLLTLLASYTLHNDAATVFSTVWCKNFTFHKTYWSRSCLTDKHMIKSATNFCCQKVGLSSGKDECTVRGGYIGVMVLKHIPQLWGQQWKYSWIKFWKRWVHSQRWIYRWHGFETYSTIMGSTLKISVIKFYYYIWLDHLQVGNLCVWQLACSNTENRVLL